MTNHLQKTPHPIIRLLSPLPKESQEEQDLITIIARTALIKDEELEPEEVLMHSDGQGNIIVEEKKTLISTNTDSERVKKIFRLSQEEVYKRITEAIKKRMDLLERLYEQNIVEEDKWQNYYFGSALISIGLLLLTGCSAIAFTLWHLQNLELSLATPMIILGLCDGLFFLWTFKQHQRSHMYVDLYRSHLKEITGFASTINLLATSNIDTHDKRTLQKAIVYQALDLNDNTAWIKEKNNAPHKPTRGYGAQRKDD